LPVEHRLYEEAWIGATSDKLIGDFFKRPAHGLRPRGTNRYRVRGEVLGLLHACLDATTASVARHRAKPSSTRRPQALQARNK
jgi:hypothetical protein